MVDTITVMSTILKLMFTFVCIIFISRIVAIKLFEWGIFQKKKIKDIKYECAEHDWTSNTRRCVFCEKLTLQSNYNSVKNRADIAEDKLKEKEYWHIMALQRATDIETEFIKLREALVQLRKMGMSGLHEDPMKAMTIIRTALKED